MKQDGATPNDFFLLEDGDNSHGNRGKAMNKVRRFKANHGIRSYKNPAYSPEINVIENVWRIIKQRVKKRGVFFDIEALKQALLEEWDRVTMEEIRALIRTMPTRIDEVWIRDGRPIPY